MIGGKKKYNFDFDNVAQRFFREEQDRAEFDELNKKNLQQAKSQVESQAKSQELLDNQSKETLRRNVTEITGNPIAGYIAPMAASVAKAIQEPFKTIGKGMEQIGTPIIGTGGRVVGVNPGDNVIAGAINLATGIAEIPMLIGTVPLSLISSGLEEIGLKSLTEPVNKAFQTIQEAPANTAEALSEALEKNGVATQIRNYVDYVGTQFGITPGSIRIDAEKGQEIKDAINNLSGLAAITGVGLLGGYLKSTKGTIAGQKKLIEQGLPKDQVLKMKPKEVLEALDIERKKELLKAAVEDQRLEKVANEQTKKEITKEFGKETLEIKNPEVLTEEALKKDNINPSVQNVPKTENIEQPTTEKPRIKVYGTLEKVKEAIDKPLDQVQEIPKPKEIKTAKDEVLKSNADPETVGITIQKMNDLRDKVGLPELEKTARQHIPEELNKVITQIEDGIRTPDRLLDELAGKKETASQAFEAVYHLTKENNKFDNIALEIADAKAKGDIGLVKTLEISLNESVAKISAMTRAFKSMDTDWGRYGRFMQEQMKRDYSTERIISRAQAKSPTGEIPEPVKQKLVEYSSELVKVNDAINRYQKKFPERTIDDFIKDIQRKESFTQRKQQRAITKEQLKTEREQLWADLYKATSVSAANIPLTPEAIKVMGRLAENYVKTGITTAQGLVDEFYNGFQGKVSKEDIMRAISGYGLEKKKPTKTELQQQLSDAKKEIRLLLQIENAKKGIYETRGERKPQPQRITELQQQLKNIRKEDVDLSDATKLKSQKTRALNSIKDLERKLKDKDFAPKEKTQVKEDKELTDLRVKERDLKRKVELEIYRIEQSNLTGWQKTKKLGGEIANIPRTLLATFDLSMPFRQGLPATFANPKVGYEAIKEMHKAAGSPKYFDELMTRIEKDPDIRKIEKMGTQFTGIGDDLVQIAKREEAYIASRILNRIPIIKQTLGAGVRFSERGAVANLNWLRYKYSKDMIKTLEAKGLTVQNNLKAYQDAGQVINWMTGRANLGALERIPGIANVVLFSPRTFVAKWQMMNPANYVLLSPEARKLFIKGQMATVMQGMMFLNLAKLAGMEVEVDPRSSDFAKARLGNTRLDFFGGMQQNMVFATRLAFGVFGQPAVKSLSTGEIYKLNTGGFNDKTLLSVIGQYVRNKLSPQTALGVDYLSGKTTMGENTSENFKNDPLGRFIPLVWQDLLEAQKELGWGAIGTGLMGFYGMGVQTFKQRGSQETKTKQFKDYDFNFDIDFNFNTED